MSLWSDIFQGGAAAAGAYDQYNRVSDLGQQASDDMNALGTQLAADSQFTPYTVSSGIGTTNVGADGSTQSMLSTEQQQWQDAMQQGGMNAQQYGADAQQFLQGAMTPEMQAGTQASSYGNLNNFSNNAYQGATGAMANATADPRALEQDLFGRMMAAQQPGIDRARLNMEERMLSQGRGGVSTAAYGGTPEQLAMEMAIGESQNNAWAQAHGMSQSEQQNQLNTALGLGQQGMAGNQLAQGMANSNVNNMAQLSQVGGGLQSMMGQAAGQYGQAAMLPQAMLLDQANSAQNNAQMNQAGQLAGTGMQGQLGLGGIQVQTNMEQIANEMLGGMWGNIAGIAGGIGSQVDADGFGGLWDNITGAF